jgi:hypothetical protein
MICCGKKQEIATYVLLLFIASTTAHHTSIYYQVLKSINSVNIAYIDLSVRGSTRYFYPPKMVFGTS